MSSSCTPKSARLHRPPAAAIPFAQAFLVSSCNKLLHFLASPPFAQIVLFYKVSEIVTLSTQRTSPSLSRTTFVLQPC